MGTPIIKKLKVKGSKGEREVDTLFDTGATHSYIKKDIGDALEPAQRKIRLKEITFEGEKEVEQTVALFEIVTDGCIGVVPLFLREVPQPIEMILGADVMNSMKIKLNLEDGEVEFGKCPPSIALSPMLNPEPQVDTHIEGGGEETKKAVYLPKGVVVEVKLFKKREPGIPALYMSEKFGVLSETDLSFDPFKIAEIEKQEKGEQRPEHIPPDTWEMMQRIRKE